MSEVPKRSQSPGTAANASTGSASKGSLRVLSAERKDRLPAGGGARPIAPRLKSGAEDAVLNALSRAREAGQDFQRLDRFFKYKLLIIGLWVLTSAVTLAVVLPHSEKATNDLGARLVVSTVLDHPVYMVKNEGSVEWKDVVVVVNNRFRAAAAEVEPGHDLIFGPKQLMGENGAAAPANLELVDFEVRTSRGNTKLVEQGQFH